MSGVECHTQDLMAANCLQTIFFSRRYEPTTELIIGLFPHLYPFQTWEGVCELCFRDHNIKLTFGAFGPRHWRNHRQKRNYTYEMNIYFTLKLN